MLTIKNLTFNYGASKILDDLSLQIKKGETVAIIGSSGSGKTTFLRLLCGILKPSSGSIEAPLHEYAYMTQQDLLLPWRTVEENITLTLELEKIPFLKPEIELLLEKLELFPFRGHYPHQLSGGQYKRVMLARTLAPKKNILLLDEAFSSLDLPLRDKLYSRLKELSTATTILVTHDFRDAYTLADRIILLNKGKVGQEWIIEQDKKEDPIYLGTLFKELKEALSLSTSF